MTSNEKLQEQLESSQKTINYLNDHIDKQAKKLDQVNGAIDLFVNGKRKEGVTLDTIINVMEWTR